MLLHCNEPRVSEYCVAWNHVGGVPSCVNIRDLKDPFWMLSKSAGDENNQTSMNSFLEFIIYEMLSLRSSHFSNRLIWTLEFMMIMVIFQESCDKSRSRSSSTSNKMFASAVFRTVHHCFCSVRVFGQLKLVQIVC